MTAEKAAQHAAKEAEKAHAAAPAPAFLIAAHPEILKEEEELKARLAAEKAPHVPVEAPRGPTIPVSPHITKVSKKRKSPSPPHQVFTFKVSSGLGVVCERLGLHLCVLCLCCCSVDLF
jgi:hypothetical protein